MMQEIGNDSNGEGTYDFVADAKKDSQSGLSSSNPTPSQSSRASPFPVYAPPPSTNQLSSSSGNQKPSYEFPPGASMSSSFSSSKSFAPPHSGISSIQSQLASGPDLSEFMNALPAVKNPSPITATTAFQPVKSGSNLAEAFGADVLSKLPPLQSQKPSLPAGLGGIPANPSTQPTNLEGHPSSSPFSAPFQQTVRPLAPLSSGLPSYGLPQGLPPPPTGLAGDSGASVNPYSSQAAASHLPSFSGLPPLPAGLQGVNATMPASSIPSQSLGAMGSLPGSAPSAVPMMAVNSPPASSGNSILPPVLPPPIVPPSFPTSFPSYSSPDASAPPQAYSTPGTNQYQSPSSDISMGFGSPQPQYLSQNASSGFAGGNTSSGFAGGIASSWLAKTSLDTIKSVTEKAKSTISSGMGMVMNTLDPQMKQFSNTGSGGEPLTKEISLVYIGNETNSMLDAIKMGFEGIYKTCHVYTRSGAAIGHKMQKNFASALEIATVTINNARSSPQLQTSLLIAVEPFVVELRPDHWYLSSCVVLSVPGGALLHVYTQLCPLSQGIIPQGESVLPLPLDDLVMRVIPNATKESWMEPLAGISWGATVALAARQLAANYRSRF